MDVRNSTESSEEDLKETLVRFAIADSINGNNQAVDASSRLEVKTKATRSITHCGLACKLCTEEIKGTRWLCKQCPQWNVCDHCLPLTQHSDIHPVHSFIRITSSQGVFPRDSLYPFGLPTSHLNTLPAYFGDEIETKSPICKGCQHIIVGPRYECSVMQCRGSGVTFCEDCEALPVPCHPETHPLIKYKLAKYRCIPINYPRTVVANETNNMTGDDIVECLLNRKPKA